MMEHGRPHHPNPAGLACLAEAMEASRGLAWRGQAKPAGKAGLA